MTCLSLDNLIYNPIDQGFIWCHEKIPIGILCYFLNCLIAIFRHEFVQTSLREQNLLRLNLNIGRLPLRTTQRLMDHNPRIRQALPLPRRSCPQEKSTHTRRHSETNRLYVTGYELHCIVDGESRGDGSARGVDIEGDVLVRVLVREEEELGHENVGDLVVDVGSEEEDAVFEEAGNDVNLTLATAVDGWAGWRGAPLRAWAVWLRFLWLIRHVSWIPESRN